MSIKYTSPKGSLTITLPGEKKKGWFAFGRREKGDDWNKSYPLRTYEDVISLRLEERRIIEDISDESNSKIDKENTLKNLGFKKMKQ